MHPNAELIDRFYSAFTAMDGQTMAACYSDDATFSDPVFPNLDAASARAMWLMFTEQSADLRVEHSAVGADDTSGSAHWEAWYTFSATGRKVHNVIDAEFVFRDGLIVTHRDSFDLYAWTKQALGLPGTLFGWSPIVRAPLQKKAGQQLAHYMAKKGL